MIGKARSSKHIRQLIWRESDVVEVRTMIISPYGTECWSVWRVIRRERDKYEVRLDFDDNGRFTPALGGKDYPSLDEALCVIEASEAGSHEEAELLHRG